MAPFDAFRSYQDGWDGYGAKAPLPSSLDAANAFYALLPEGAQKAAHPGVHAAGHAMIEIRHDPAYAVFEFPWHGRIEIFVIAPGVEMEAGDPFDGSALPRGISAAMTNLFR